MSTYLIHPIVMGSKVFDKGMMTYQYGYGQPYTIPIYCWYLEGGDKKVLVDTGEMHPIQSKDRQEKLGGPICTFEEGLARYGLRPEDIEVVIHTHLHRDHCENDYKCVNAEFFVHAKELETLRAGHPLDFRYVEDFILEVEANGQITHVHQDREILPGIRVVHTPAHTPGGMSVLVDTPGGRAVITGFCTILENLYPPRDILAMEMEVIPPGTLVNAAEAYDILLGSKGLGDYLLPLHEPLFARFPTITGPVSP
jgi:glyoxylase-like metal-dependent hydrolase (beta-lactamase superfamily II)